MIAHLSVPARDPKSTALFFAAVIDGQAFPFPVVPDAWIAVSKDGSGTAVEVYPETMAHHPGQGAAGAPSTPSDPRTMPWEDQIFEDGAPRPSTFHVAIASRLGVEQILALAKPRGWRALACERAGVFGVVEVWIDDLVLVEVL